MNIFSTLSFISAFAFILLIFNISKSKVNTKSKAFMLIINSALFIWTFGWCFIYFAQEPESAMFWYRFSSVGWLFTFNTLLHFSLVLTRTVEKFKIPSLVYLIHIPSLVFLFQSFTSDNYLIKGFVINGSYSSMNILDYDSIWFHAFTAWVMLYSFLTIYFLYRWGRKSKRNSERKQAYTMILAILTPLAFGILSNYLVRRLFDDFPPTDAITNILFAFLLWYAISKYKFLKLTTDTILEEIVTSMSEFLIMVDTNHNIIKVNKRAEQLICTVGEYEQKNILSIFLEKEIVQRLILNADIFGKYTKEAEVQVILKDNNKLAVKLAVSKIIDKFQDHVGFLFFASDITQRLQLEASNESLNNSKEELKIEIIEKNKILEKLFHAEKKLTNLGDNLPGGAILQGYFDDSKFKLNYVSKNIKQITGIEDKELMHSSSKVYKRIHPDDLRRVLKAGNQTKSQKILFDQEFRIRNLFEEYIWIKVRAYPRIEDNIEYWDCILFNINDKKIAEENYIKLNTELEDRVTQRTLELKSARDLLAVYLKQEQELNEMKTRFIDIVFHEFKTPLTIVFSSSEIVDLQVRNQNFEDIKSQIDKIQSSVQNMNKLLNNIKHFQTSSDILKKFNPENFNIEVALQNSIRKLQLDEKQAKLINIKLSLENSIIQTDQKMFEQIIYELIENSLKFSDELSPIEINLREKDDILQIQIKDNGTGISKIDMDKIFQPFYKAKEKIGLESGLGLGLSIVKKYLELMGGEIKVNSEIEKGSEFNFSLPRRISKKLRTFSAN